VAAISGGYSATAVNIVEAVASNCMEGTAIVKLYPHSHGAKTSNAFIDASCVQIRNVATPTDVLDAANKAYADRQDEATFARATNALGDWAGAGFVSKSGDTMAGHLHMSGNAIHGLGALHLTAYRPLCTQSVDFVADVYVVVDGPPPASTPPVPHLRMLTGAAAGRVMQTRSHGWADPYNQMYYAYQLTDSSPGAIQAGDVFEVYAYDPERHAALECDVDGYRLTGLATPASPADAATKAYVDSATGAITTAYVKKAGDTMSGQLILMAPPVAANHAVNKTYIDAKQFGAANILNGAVTSAKLADNAVTSAKIVDGTVAAADLASGAVTADKLANRAVTAAKLHQMGAASGQVLKWNGSAWAPAPDAGGMSQAEADVRYVNAGGDTMSGPLTAPALYATGPENWRVGSPLQPSVHIELVGQHSKISTINGKSLVLAPKGSHILCETNTAVNGNLAVAGSVTAARGISSAGPLALAAPWAGTFNTATTGSTTVPVPGMTPQAIVVVTPCGSSAPLKTANYAYRVDARQNSFVLYYSKDCYNMQFNYIVIQP